MGRQVNFKDEDGDTWEETFKPFRFHSKIRRVQIKQHLIPDSKDEDLAYQMNFWNRVLKEAKKTKHQALIQQSQRVLDSLRAKLAVEELQLPLTPYDFQTESISDWHLKLHGLMTHLPNDHQSNQESVDNIAKFYISLLDYLVNPKLT